MAFLAFAGFSVPNLGLFPSRNWNRGMHEVHLPADRVHCSMRVAYQSADASHPKGSEQARREQGNFAGQFIYWETVSGKVFIGEASPEKGAGRIVTILTTGWSCLLRLMCAWLPESIFTEVIHRSIRAVQAESAPRAGATGF